MGPESVVNSEPSIRARLSPLHVGVGVAGVVGSGSAPSLWELGIKGPIQPLRPQLLPAREGCPQERGRWDAGQRFPAASPCGVAHSRDEEFGRRGQPRVQGLQGSKRHNRKVQPEEEAVGQAGKSWFRGWC